MSEENISYNAVMYTDGSCLPPRGAYGGGCHGYLYTQASYKKNGDKPNNYTVTDDGYLEKHEMPSLPENYDPTDTNNNIPRELKPEFYYNAVYPYGSEGTNNKAELLAVIDTIRILVETQSILKILFCTDSMYVINVYNMVSADLTKRSWLNDDRPNLDLWVKLADILLTVTNIQISFKKVVAHGTAIGNNVADRLAFTAREISVSGRSGEKHLFYKGRYWKDKPTPHPMLNFKQVYFNVGVMANTDEHMYVIMDYPKDVEVGKKSSEPLFGVTIFNKSVPEIDNVINLYLEHCRGNQFLTTIDLRVLYTQTHNKMSELLGTDTYSYNRNRLSLLGEDLLVTPIIPPGLAQNTLIKTLAMYKLYQTYKATTNTTDGVVSVIEITDQLYDITDKGKWLFKFNTNVVGPNVEFIVDKHKIKIDLIYGKDILTRNQLKKLESSKPKMSIILHKCSDDLFEYYVLIETKEAVGVYGNYYINKLYV